MRIHTIVDLGYLARLQRHASRSMRPAGRLVALMLGVLLGVAGMFPASAAAAGQGDVQRALDATVFIRAQRLYQRHDVSTTGSGFFVHPDGYIMTSLGVVSNQVFAIVKGELRRFTVSVTGIKVVVNPGSPNERALTAEIVAKDRLNHLALLKVDYRTSSFLAPEQGTTVELVDEVMVIGYPFGKLLSFDDSGGTAPDRYPEPTLSMGRVTSLRRNEDNREVAIQTDAAINPGSSGGPMLDKQGRLLGVVYAEVGQGTQIGFASAPGITWDFYLRQTIQVEFSPSYVPVPRGPVVITVEPGILPLDAATGVARAEGRNIDPVEIALQPAGGAWRGSLSVPEAADEVPGESSYVVSLRFSDNAGRTVVQRSFRLAVERSTEVPISAITDAAQTMDDRKDAYERSSIEEYAREHRNEVSEAELGIREARADEKELHTDLTRYGKEFYKQGRYGEAIRVLSRVLEVDPDDEVAREYLELAHERQRLRSAGPHQDAAPAVPMPDTDEDTGTATAAGPVTLRITFDPPYRKGSIRIWLDDEALAPLEFDFKKGEGGRLRETVELQSGRHIVRVAVEDKKSVLASKSFTETLQPGSAWTLRINQASEEHTPGIFFVEQR